jgi:hypothetical protein
MIGLIGCSSTNNYNVEVVNSKNHLKIINTLGKECREIKNQPLFYIYYDGTVEKRIIID